uniref:Uncharacterized protein n=1 Tax=Candidatus Kentrum sp. TC TaxID=2126339 RepID=A0A450ZBY8_9GAMM|nr:MAG: hypothetical protein BECKTC1821F_GA0114240_100132 [Candidatus Kentron sp. TC]
MSCLKFSGEAGSWRGFTSDRHGMNWYIGGGPSRFYERNFSEPSIRFCLIFLVFFFLDPAMMIAIMKLSECLLAGKTQYNDSE